MKSVMATEHIYASGLCLYEIRFGAFNGRNNEVLEQFPQAGASIAAGSSVTITVTPAGLSGSVYQVPRPPSCERPVERSHRLSGSRPLGTFRDTDVGS